MLSFSEVMFIYEFGPIVGSQAYQYARRDQRLVDSLYRTLPHTKRVEINNKIIGNTMRKAIERKDKTMAERGAGFARNTWANDRLRGQRVYLNNMLSFYRSTKDTVSYIPSAMHYYNRYFMAIPQDSAAKIVAREKQLLQARRASGAAMADAAAWSKRTVELDPNFAYFHTYAMLLYRLEDFKGAEANMQAAIKLAKQNNTSADWLQEALRKIKSRKL